MARKKAVITGASSGIGRALSLALAEEYDLFLCGRNQVELKKTVEMLKGKGEAKLISLDLTDDSSIQKATDEILQLTDSIDLLINNAGQSQRSFATETTEKTEKHLFQVNYFGPIAFTKHLMPALRKGKGAKIAIISSIVGKFGFPLRSTYSAAKHALHGYFESLLFEESKNNIAIQFMIIGRAKTNISQNALKGEGTKYGTLDKGQQTGLTTEECAERIRKALYTNKKEVLIGGKEKWMVYFKKYIPFLFYYFGNKESNHV